MGKGISHSNPEDPLRQKVLNERRQVSTKAKGEELLQDPTPPRGVIGLLQIKEDGKDKLFLAESLRNVVLQAQEGVSRRTETPEPKLKRG